MEEILCNVEIVKDNNNFIARIQSDLGGMREYKSSNFEEVLEQMTDLSLERNTINVKNLKETTPFQLKVQKPSEDAILSNDTITVTVEIEEEEP